MLPVIAIVGRPNVGKSTLFNRLTKTRNALVIDIPGVTRDRQYGQGKVGSSPYIVIDTGGICGELSAEGLDEHISRQAQIAIEESDCVLFLVDGRQGLSNADQTIARQLRQINKKAFVVVNKTDGIDESTALSDFYSLGFHYAPIPIAASHGRGVNVLMEMVCETFPQEEEQPLSASNTQPKGIKIAIVGRPNVGKTTLANRMLGEERVVVFDQAGTTRDSIFLPLERHGQHYTLIDTAGVRRKSRVSEALEKFSVVKTLQAIEAANVVLMIVDAQRGIAEQDLTLLGFILDTGRALVIAINKWDGLALDVREEIKEELQRRLTFVNFARLHFISALRGSGVGELYRSINEAYASAMCEMPTALLTDLLGDATTKAPPPLVRGRRVKLNYAHTGGHNPPLVVIHGKQTESLPGHYQRYLSNYLREKLKLVGTPLQLEFKTGDNPFKGRRNVLTPRQQYKRKRAKKRFKK
ncbi:MAG: ribosome biogenesis GTPase Der [Gammaproteobacteria bacterium]|nr:ribosome biogenesis GTPase Der [Gammaproteobacteria bacterium]